MKWMKWTGRSPVERAAAALPNLRRRRAGRTINRRPTLRRDRAVEPNGLTKKFPAAFFARVEVQRRINTDDLIRKAGTQEPTSPFPGFLFSRFEKSEFAEICEICGSPISVCFVVWLRSGSTIQRFNDLTAAKQFVFIRVYSWLTFADGCG